jgi:hypothetical protein
VITAAEAPSIRVCSACGQPKSLVDDFSPRPNGRYGRQARCKECLREVYCSQRLRRRYKETRDIVIRIADAKAESEVIKLGHRLVVVQGF